MPSDAHSIQRRLFKMSLFGTPLCVGYGQRIKVYLSIASRPILCDAHAVPRKFYRQVLRAPVDLDGRGPMMRVRTNINGVQLILQVLLRQSELMGAATTWLGGILHRGGRLSQQLPLLSLVRIYHIKV
jgi:hypothetical protein